MPLASFIGGGVSWFQIIINLPLNNLSVWFEQFSFLVLVLNFTALLKSNYFDDPTIDCLFASHWLLTEYIQSKS